MTTLATTTRVALALLSLMLIPCWTAGGSREDVDADLAEAALGRLVLGGWVLSWLIGATVVLTRRSSPLGAWSRLTILLAVGSITGNTVWFRAVGPVYPAPGSAPVTECARLLLDLALLCCVVAVPTLALYWKVTPDRTGSRQASDRGAE